MRSRRVRAHRIDDIGTCRDVAAEAAERLRQCALDHVDAVQRAVACGDAGAGRPATFGVSSLAHNCAQGSESPATSLAKLAEIDRISVTSDKLASSVKTLCSK